jgi:triosephosphate isomerase
MRRLMVAGNWKLNKGPAEARDLVGEISAGLAERSPRCEVLVCPPFLSIPAAVEAARGSVLLVGGQNCATERSGAFTGEISAEMLAATGASHVIIAHSERRQYQRESDEEFVHKIDRAHQAGLVAIFCFGEVLHERKQGKAEEVVRDQLSAVLPRVADVGPANTVLAYEPVWAIGTGETATPDIAQQIHGLTRSLLADMFDRELADDLRILYGGSCKPDNARELFRQSDIDGGLIGGASLKARDFLGIVDAAETVAG